MTQSETQSQLAACKASNNKIQRDTATTEIY
jgi:hypothetical protein